MDHVSHLSIETEGQAMLVLASVEMMFKARHRWTDDDVAILRELYPSGGPRAVADRLPQKTIGAIHKKAESLGLKCLRYKRRVERFLSSPYIDEAIRRYYQGTPRRGGLSKLGHQVQRPVRWIAYRANALGFVPSKFADKPWSEAEYDLLRRYASKVPNAIMRIFRKHGFKRTTNAINIKLVRMRCDRTEDGIYHANGLAELLGVNPPVLTGWIKKGWLKAHAKGTTRQHDIWLIHHTAVRRFVIENPGAIDIRRVDKLWFIDLLAGHK